MVNNILYYRISDIHSDNQIIAKIFEKVTGEFIHLRNLLIISIEFLYHSYKYSIFIVCYYRQLLTPIPFFNMYGTSLLL